MAVAIPHNVFLLLGKWVLDCDFFDFVQLFTGGFQIVFYLREMGDGHCVNCVSWICNKFNDGHFGAIGSLYTETVAQDSGEATGEVLVAMGEEVEFGKCDIGNLHKGEN